MTYTACQEEVKFYSLAVAHSNRRQVCWIMTQKTDMAFSLLL